MLNFSSFNTQAHKILVFNWRSIHFCPVDLVCIYFQQAEGMRRRETIAALFALCTIHAINAIVTNVSELELDENGHLQSHWLLTSSGCTNLLAAASTKDHLVMRKTAVMSDELATEFLGKYSPCVAVSLERGAPGYQLMHPLPRDLFHGINGFEDWLVDRRKVEVGFMHFLPNPVSIYWVSGREKKKLVDILPFEKHTFWSHSYLGHVS